MEEEKQRYNLFKELGLLIKRITCLYPTHDRLRIMISFLNKVNFGFPTANNMFENGSNTRFILKCLGFFFHKVIAGWDENECIVVFNLLEKLFDMDTIMYNIFESPFGSKIALEYFVRSYYRLMCLDHCLSFGDRVFWLSLILRKHCHKNCTQRELNQSELQSKLLIILYGPLLVDTYNSNKLPSIAWWDLTDTFFIDDGLRELGFSVHLLHRHLDSNRKWSNEEIILLVNNIFIIPDKWLLENIATFLFYCGDEIVKLVIRQRFVNGYISDVANCIAYLTLISFKLKSNSNWILEILDDCCASEVDLELKRSLISEIPDAFNEALADIEHLVDVNDERDITELHDMMSAQTSFMRALLAKTYSFVVTSNQEKAISCDFEE